MSHETSRTRAASRLASSIVVATLALGCGSAGRQDAGVAGKPKPAGSDRRNPDPQQVPRDMVLFDGAQIQPVVLVRLEVSRNAKPRVLDQKVSRGVPNVAVANAKSPVLVTTQDVDKRPLQAFGIDNPLLIRTTGSQAPATGQLDRAVVVIAVPMTDKTAFLDVKILQGPGKGQTDTVPLAP